MNNKNLKKNIFDKLFLSNKNDENNKKNFQKSSIDDHQKQGDKDQNFITINGKKISKKNNKHEKNFFEKLFSSKKDKEKNDDEYDLKNNEEFNIDDYEEVDDDDQNFIIIDGKKMRKKKKKILEQPKVKKIIDDLIMADPDSYLANQQRNLDRETGGTELPENYTTSALDVWDNRVEEIEEMAEIKPQDFNSDDKASMIWDKKRKKKQEEAHKGNQEPKKHHSKSFFSTSTNKGSSREF
jgi:hypothetical protein